MLRTAFCAFPAAGNRNGSDVNNVQNNGNYWSATGHYDYYASYLGFESVWANRYGTFRYEGQSVRLVQD
jgi:hypothetical protein